MIQVTSTAGAEQGGPEGEGELISIRSLGPDWRLNNLDIQIGRAYAFTGEVKPPNSGFSALHGHPGGFQTFFQNSNRLAVVRQSGHLAAVPSWSIPGIYSLVWSGRMVVEFEITRAELTERAWDWVWKHGRAEGAMVITTERGVAAVSEDHCAAHATGVYGVAVATGSCAGALAEGERGVAVASGGLSAAKATGTCGVANTTFDSGAAIATRGRGAAVATGECSLATVTGCFGTALTTGPKSAAIATDQHGVAVVTSGFSRATASGDAGAAVALGEYSVATASGEDGVALASGLHGRVHGKHGCGLFLVRREVDGQITHAWAAIVGQGDIRAGVWYTLNDSGDPVEADVP